MKVHSTPPVHCLYRHRPLECKHLVCTLDLWVPEPCESNRNHHGCGYMKVEVIEACYFLDGIVFVLQTCTYALLHGPLCCSSEIASCSSSSWLPTDPCVAPLKAIFSEPCVAPRLIFLDLLDRIQNLLVIEQKGKKRWSVIGIHKRNIGLLRMEFLSNDGSGAMKLTRDAKVLSSRCEDKMISAYYRGVSYHIGAIYEDSDAIFTR